MAVRPWLAALLVVLVVTSGCSGLFGSGQSPESTPPTPAPVPTTPPPLAPGLSADGVVDPGQLGAANRRALNGTAYELSRTVAVSGPNGTLRIDRVQRVAADGVAIGRLSVSGEGPVGTAVRNWTRYRESTVVWSRTRLSNGNTVTNRLISSDSSPYFIGRALPERLYRAGSFEVTRRSADRIVLESTVPFELERGTTELETSPPRNVSVRAVLTEEGLVRELSVTYDASVGSTRVSVRLTQSVERREVTVRKPAWVPQA
jgi:hypothetical protein